MSNGSSMQAATQQHPVLHSLMAIKNSPYRKGFSTFEDSDGNNADNDSVNSVISSGHIGELFRCNTPLSSVFACTNLLWFLSIPGFGGQQRQLQYGETDSVSTLNEATITQASMYLKYNSDVMN